LIFAALIVAFVAYSMNSANQDGPGSTKCNNDAIRLGQATPGTREFYNAGQQRVADGCVTCRRSEDASTGV
jgi:hypothetical protein